MSVIFFPVLLFTRTKGGVTTYIICLDRDEVTAHVIYCILDG
jgi:hypothetical protein